MVTEDVYDPHKDYVRSIDYPVMVVCCMEYGNYENWIDIRDDDIQLLSSIFRSE